MGRYIPIIPMMKTGTAKVAERRNVLRHSDVSLCFWSEAICESFCVDVGRKVSCGKEADKASTSVRSGMRVGEWESRRWVGGKGKETE